MGKMLQMAEGVQMPLTLTIETAVVTLAAVILSGFTTFIVGQRMAIKTSIGAAKKMKEEFHGRVAMLESLLKEAYVSKEFFRNHQEFCDKEKGDLVETLRDLKGVIKEDKEARQRSEATQFRMLRAIITHMSGPTSDQKTSMLNIV